ncbi:MAG: hypothetical protein IH986_12890 [Planctomycetes bacterium]|nr:hypothetical protein [Planctomycetota bacterium]
MNRGRADPALALRARTPSKRAGRVRRKPLEREFHAIDWAVLVGYLIFTTALGAKLAGKQATIRDFFLGGRKLPWPAVTGSIIATEISAVTFIAVPAIAFGGDLKYLQLALGAILARIIIGVWFVRAFYEREIYSPYDYIGNRLGRPARSVTTGLFVLGAILGQSVRVLTTAIVLELMTGMPLWAAIWIIGAIAVGWSLLGGITTVIWTDVIQFFVFALGLLVALGYVIYRLPGHWDELQVVAAAAGKWQFWDTRLEAQLTFTIWTALFANTLMCLSAYGTDQLIAQRMFCCRGPREARKAVIWSSVGQLVTLIAMLVGIGLYAFYQQFPLEGEAARLVADKHDRILPVFILQELPAGLVGLLIAGVFAAAVSSLDSVLTALSQTVITGFYRPWRETRDKGTRDRGIEGSRAGERAAGNTPPAPDRRRAPSEEDSSTEAPEAGNDDQHYVFVSKMLVIVWGLVLCAMAQISVLALDHYGALLDLALAMASFTGGAMLAAFLLAFFKLRIDHRGIVWSAPLSVLVVFAISWHQTWALWTTIILAAALLIGWTVHTCFRAERRRLLAPRDWARAALIALGALLAVVLCGYTDPAGNPLNVAWPWNVPIGFTVAFGWGYLLAGRRVAGEPRTGRDSGGALAP